MLADETYEVRYWFEWRGPCLWSANDAARREFDYAVDYADVPLSAETIARIEELTAWHDTALNWDYPPDPGPWRQEECDRFNQAASDLYRQLVEELGPRFEVVDERRPETEDPDLDEYLRDPKGFKRKRP